MHLKKIEKAILAERGKFTVNSIHKQWVYENEKVSGAFTVSRAVYKVYISINKEGHAYKCAYLLLL